MLRSVRKWIGQQLWSPVSGHAVSTFDGDERQPPGVNELIGLYEEETVYACVRLIRQETARVPLCLVSDVQTERYPTNRTKHRRTKSVEPVEIQNHPVLALLDKPNPDKWSRADLIATTQLSLEVAGHAYWLKVRGNGETLPPTELWFLPPQLVEIVKDEETGRIAGFLVGTKKRPYPIRDIVHFVNRDLVDPYCGDGDSPLKAVWRRVLLSRKELKSWDAVLSQMAQPHWMLSPKEGEFISQEEAERLAREFTNRFYGNGNGGVWVNTHGIEGQPISFPPKDVAGIQVLYDTIVSAVCRAYQVPRPLLDMQDSNRASATTALSSFQRLCLLPRVNYFCEVVTTNLVHEFDERLWLTHDDFILADIDQDIADRGAAVSEYSVGIRTRNETRSVCGLDPVDGGDEFTAPLADPFSDQGADTTPTPADTPNAIPAEQVADTALNGAQIGSLLDVCDRLATRQIPPEAARAILTASFPTLPAAVIERIVSSLAKFSPAAPAPAPAPEQATKAVKPERGKSSQMLARFLRKLFEKQRQHVLSRLTSVKGEDPGNELVPFDDWLREAVEKLRPALAVYYEDGANRMSHRLGLLGVPRVVQPRIREAVEKAVIELAQSTVETTSKDITDAIAETKKALAAGLEQGEVYNQLAARVNEVFDSASFYRAYSIAATESTKAKSRAEIMVVQESGVKAKKVWLADNLACPICSKFDGRAVDPDKPFGRVRGKAVYVPGESHVNCRCALTWDIQDLNNKETEQ